MSKHGDFLVLSPSRYGVEHETQHRMEKKYYVSRASVSLTSRTSKVACERGGGGAIEVSKGPKTWKR